MGTTWKRHLLSLAEFSPADYELVVQTTLSFQEVLSRRNKKVPSLQGKLVAHLFLSLRP
ncbi:MAG: aspartate carbamoyltransferase, partial [Oscillatoriales cyanobacterium SM2_2_1]|nr:aspartate carbamoyltransferase [Oscillatoriales cyanobacterium SM2_2_1]